jgi:hypothetical protein
MHTPASVHFGTAEQIQAQRQATLDRKHSAGRLICGGAAGGGSLGGLGRVGHGVIVWCAL